MNKLELAGKQFGLLSVIRESPKRRRKSGRIFWVCSCRCGSEIEVQTTDLTSGKKSDCGCVLRLRLGLRNAPNINDTAWKQITDFPEYYIHPLGFVKSVKNGIGVVLKSFMVKGYKSVNLVQSNPFKRVSARVHVLVAEAFIGERPSMCDVMHLDGDGTNASLSNLRYGSKSCNEAFKIDHGTALVGERHHQAKLKDTDIYSIRKMLKEGATQIDVSKIYGISNSAISAIKRGRTWNHI